MGGATYAHDFGLSTLEFGKDTGHLAELRCLDGRKTTRLFQERTAFQSIYMAYLYE